MLLSGHLTLLRRILLALMLVALHQSGFAGAPPAPTSSITVVVDDNFPPYAFHDAKGQLQGIDKDLWALWSKKTGIAVNLKTVRWVDALQQVQNGEADVIDNIYVTEKRQRLFDFSPPYADNEVQVFFRNSISGITDVASLKGFTVGVKNADACIDFLQANHIDNLKVYPSEAALINAAVAREVVMFCMDKNAAMYYLYRSGHADAFRATPTLFVGQLRWAVRKGNLSMRQTVAQGFMHISDAERRVIENRWMGMPLPMRSTEDLVRFGLKLLAAVLLILLLVLLWTRSLQKRVIAKTAEQAATLDNLNATLRYLEATLEAIPDLLFEMDVDGTYHECRSTRPELLINSPEALLGHNVREVMPAEAAEATISALQQAARDGASHGTHIKLELPVGERWFELSAARKQVEPGMPQRLIMISHDITDNKRDEAAIRELAFFDPLTRLPNRRTLQERLTHTVARCLQQQCYAALLFLDLDNFKLLNDTHGHNMGDLLLQKVAERLQGVLREQDFLGRFGGDEFIVILDRLSPEADLATHQAAMVADKLLSEIRQPFRLHDVTCQPTVSVGVCLFNGQNGQQADGILKRADLAMYEAKAGGRNTVSFFAPEMKDRQDRRARLDSELRQAIDSQQFVLFFQPQVDRHRTRFGAEVLLRWQHPLHGIVAPGEFIPQAEESGLIAPIGAWVIQQSCRQLAQWQRHVATRHLRLSVNVSAGQFRLQHFVPDIRQTLHRYNINPALLTFELTESMLLHNIDESIDKMRQLQALGIQLSLDDFGTGYASLSYLKALPLNEIKIDQSFIQDVTTDNSNAILARTIIDIARNFRLDVVAEGVETEAQRSFLLDNGCTLHQGFLYGQPLAIDEFEAQLVSQADTGRRTAFPGEPAIIYP